MNASQKELPYQLAEYSCPLINPPSQRSMFENKLHNIRLAISRMAPLVLQPGQEFSFWHLALAPTLENDYREGAMFINHQVRSSVGGGLCQLSGLIYNLALLSGCDIVERYNHSIDAYGEERYIPLGQDSTVAYGRKNLRFRNPHGFPLSFELNVDPQHAWGSVRADKLLPYRIRIETQLLATLASPPRRKADPALPDGETLVRPGLSGKVVKAWRIFEGPETYRKEPLSHDCYVATPTYTHYSARNMLWMRKILDRFIPHG